MLISGTWEHTPGCSPAPLSPFLFLPASAVAASRISARRRRRPWTCILPGEEEESEVGEGSGHDVAVRRGHSGLGAACLGVRWQLPPLHTGTCVCVQPHTPLVATHQTMCINCNRKVNCASQQLCPVRELMGWERIPTPAAPHWPACR